MSAAASAWARAIDTIAVPARTGLTAGARVRLADGSSGTVVGFYRAAEPTVLVRLDSGQSRAVARPDVTTR